MHISPTQRITDNLDRVRQRIAEAARRGGRSPDKVTLVGVTKYVDVPETECLLEAGCRDLGESRPQELWRKAAALAHREVHWHLIGHLQTNKVRRTLLQLSLLHAGDSRRLLEAVNTERAADVPPRTPVLLEVNISSDAAKHGFSPDEIEPLLPGLAALPHVEIRGLMTMSGLESDERQTRAEFARLRELRDHLRSRCPPGIHFDELSMGMSGDFEIAIEEGATLVRVGSALFEGVRS